MALTEKKLGQAAVNSSETTIYTARDGYTTIVRIIWIANVSSADVTVSVWNPTASTTTADANQLIDTMTVPKNDFVQISTYIVMTYSAGAGDTIRALCSSANAATMTLYGAEIN